MKQLFQLLGRCAGLVLLPGFVALGQSAPPVPTADDFIRPYTENFQYGTNSGVYGPSWSDEDLAGIAQKAGVHSLRPTLPEAFVENFGYNVRETAFSAYVNKLGMKEITCFIGGPAAWHADFTTYPGCTQSSKLFGHLYDPIWNADGSVNPKNLYAIYVYKLLQVYGDQVRFWEVVNEPDFTNGADASAWLTRAPTPAEQLNTQAPFYNYVRMLRITYEVVKKYHPEAYVSTGGIGNPEYADALLRYTDEPTAGAVTADYPRTGGAYFDVLSFHAYPNYALHYWDNSIGGFRYTRTSDYAAERVIQYKDEMGAVLTKYGYDGTQHPAKLFVLTESNVSRRTSDDRIGSDEQQRNFNIKNLVLLQKHGVTQFYTYAVGEGVDAPAPGQSVSGSDELALMGLYQNLLKATPATAQLTMSGQAFLSTSKLLYGYAYDPARTAALALPSAVEGAAFRKGNDYQYVLWAKALVDNVEQATATYSFPASLGLATVNRSEWDYSQTSAATPQAAQNVALTTTPSFFAAGSAAPPVAACAATGSILREQWDNVNGSKVASVPVATAPSGSSQLAQLELSTTNGFNYGARVRGYLCAPLSGAYTFSLASDDDGELWLSPDADPAHKVRLATCGGWLSGIHDYTRYANQQSAPVTLVAGQQYYLEVLHKQSWGPGYFSVAMTLPDGTTEAPLAGSHLSPFVPEPTPPVVVSPPATPPAGTCAATGSIRREQWDNVNGSLVTNVPVRTAPSSTSQLAQLEATSPAFNYGARVRGYLCAPLSGAYTFSLASDDDGELWLSPDADSLHRVRIAACQGWLSGIHDYTRYANQQSAPVTLVAGQQYYLEVLHKQSWGPGYFSVAMTLPDGTAEAPLAGGHLSPFVPAGLATTNSAPGRLTAAAPGDDTPARAGSAASQLAAYPNPFTEQTTVQFSAATAGPVSLALYNGQGQLVRQLFAGDTPAGAAQSVTLERQSLATGLYLLRLVTGGRVITQKLTLN